MNMLRKMQRCFSKWQLVAKVSGEETNGLTQTKMMLLKALITDRNKLQRLATFRHWKTVVKQE